MRAQEEGPAAGEEILDPGDALLLERLVAHGKHLVGDEDIGPQRGRDSKAEAHHHARRIVLDRVVNVLADVGEGDYFIALRGNFGGREPQ